MLILSCLPQKADTVRMRLADAEGTAHGRVPGSRLWGRERTVFQSGSPQSDSQVVESAKGAKAKQATGGRREGTQEP